MPYNSPLSSVIRRCAVEFLLFGYNHSLQFALHCMPETDASLPPGNTEAKSLLLIIFIVSGWTFILFSLERFSAAIIPTVYALPICLASSLYLAIRLASKGSSSIPFTLGLLGVFFIAGGGIFDMVATVIHTPTLCDESNMVGRALLDSNHPLVFVYSYAIVTQTFIDCADLHTLDLIAPPSRYSGFIT